jgi:hypothetical protein
MRCRARIVGAWMALLVGCGSAAVGGPGPGPTGQTVPRAEVPEAPTDCQTAPQLPACREGHDDERLPASH